MTVSKTIRRYHECGDNIEEALTENPRPGQLSKITPEIEAQITAMACEQESPHGRGRWNLRLMGKRLEELEFVENISPETVRQVLKKSTQTLAEKAVVHRENRRRLPGGDSGGTQSLQSAH